ncbi:hypothetical protein D9M72_452610 [compost metagenome]
MDHGHGQLAGDRSRYPVLQLVRLVDHHDVVLRQHRQAFEGADGQHGMVGDHDVSLGGVLAGQFAEALGSHGTFLRAQAFHRRDGHLPPGTVRHPRHQFIPVPRGRLLRPLAEPDHFFAQLRRRTAQGGGEVRDAGVLAQGEELPLGRLFRGESAVELVPADVVCPALDERDLNGALQRGGDGFQQPGKVPAHDLGLQGQGGSGHQSGFVADL